MISPLPRAPWVLIYCRCSHPNSRDSGTSIPVQLKECRQWRVRILAEHSDLQAGPEFEDAAVSAKANEFQDRPGGKELIAAVQPGDHIVFYQVSRAWRLCRDGHALVDKWRAEGVTLHFVRDGVDMSTSSGRMIFGVLLAQAQYQSDDLSERMCDIKEHLRKNGWVVSGPVKKGYRRHKLPNGRKIDVPMLQQNKLEHLLVRLRDGEGRTFKEIADEVTRQNCLAHKMPVTSGALGFYNEYECRRLYGRAKERMESEKNGKSEE